MNTVTLSRYVSVSYYRVRQAEYGIHILVAASQEYVNTYSTRRLDTGSVLTKLAKPRKPHSMSRP